MCIIVLDKPQVDPAPWYDACYRDACACDSGGDCECLCTAVAAYGHECCKHGVSIKWRTQELCRKYPNNKTINNA